MTVVVSYLGECAEALKATLRQPPFSRSPLPMREAFEAVFELLELPWNDLPEDLTVWRRGYEQCMIDVISAIADEWGVALPPSPTPE